MTRPQIDLPRGKERNVKANKEASKDNRRLMRQAEQSLAAEQAGLIRKAEARIRQMSVMELEHRHAQLQIQFMLDEEAMQDPMLTSTAAKRLFARGHNFAVTPTPNSLDAIQEELDRLQFRVLGSVMRKVLERKPTSGLRAEEEELGLRHFKRPPPPSIKLLRERLTARREWARRVGLDELDFRARETSKEILDTLTMAKMEVSKQRRRSLRAWGNLSAEEEQVAKHVQKRGDIRMNKLDKNLGVVVYSVSKAKEAINKHLSSRNFELVPNEEAEGKQEARQRIWELILQRAEEVFKWVEMPEKLGQAMLQMVPHLSVRLNHMYVMWKVKIGATRPIVPAFSSPTALASKWIHDQLFPYLQEIPTICTDSLRYTKELDRLNAVLAARNDFIIVELDVVALYPSIPIEPAMQAVEKFMDENTNLSDPAKKIILGMLGWVMQNNYIEFGGLIYKQVDGVVMGAALSVVVANIFMYKAVEEPVLQKWQGMLLSYQRYIDDISVFLIGTRQDAEQFKMELEMQCAPINFTMECHNTQANFLDLRIKVQRNDSGAKLEYRIYRKPGNSMAYLHIDSFHAAHTATGIVKGEYIRYLTKSSKKEFYFEDCLMLFQAFKNRGYSKRMLKGALGPLGWEWRDYYREKALKPKIREVPGGGAVFSIQIDPAIDAALKAGFSIDLERIRATRTGGADEEVREALGASLQSVFPRKGLVALKAAPKLRALMGGGQIHEPPASEDASDNA
jgi:hypothetical protein